MTPLRFSSVRSSLLMAGLALGAVHAAEASTFTWDLSGTIAQPTNATLPLTVTGGGTNTLEWGLPEPGNFLSALSIAPTSGNVALTSGMNTSVQIGTISWTNASVFNGGGIWNTVLSLSANFGSQGTSSVARTATSTIAVNNTGDGTGSLESIYASGQDPDIITGLTLDLGSGGVPINLGNGVSLLGFSSNLVTVGQCGTSNTAPGSTLSAFTWVNCEGNTSIIGLSANLRYDAPAPIPLPAAGWLLLGSLAGLGALRARRAKRSA